MTARWLASRESGEPPADVARAGIEPATRGFSVGDSGSDVLRGSPECDETGMMVDLDGAQGSTSMSLARVATRLRHHVAAEPRHVALMLHEELARLNEGDSEGVRAVVSAIAVLLA
jgi:hypothetical protein